MPTRRDIGLPTKAFLYTTDQIATMIEVEHGTLIRSYIFFRGRSVGVRQHDLIEAHNISPENQKPEWRVAEKEFVRWLRYKGFRIYSRGSVSR